ncbi:MAG: hypothetical protein ABIR53_00210 [Paraperlucidibaca sp.]
MKAQRIVSKTFPYIAACAVLVAASSLVACSGGSSSGAEKPPQTAQPRTTPNTKFAMANNCFALQSVGSNTFAASNGAGGYAFVAKSAAGAEPFYMKPTALGEYLIQAKDATLLSNGGASVVSAAQPNNATVWSVEMPRAGIFTLTNTDTDVRMQRGAQNLLALDNTDSVASEFRFVPIEGCTAYPEISTDTVGDTYVGRGIDKPVIGFAEVHTHMAMGHEMSDGKHIVGPSAGGVMYGQMFHRFGVPHAMKDCADWHGPQGIRDPEALVLDMTPLTTHDTQGWPSFIDWPKTDSQLHQAMYYKWVERAWKAGMRIMVSEGTNIAALCEVGRLSALRPSAECNDMRLGIAQVKYLFQLQDYVDAQEGGPGKGWFRIVRSPQEARRVINDGKLAVVAGLEFANMFNCTVQFTPLGENRGCTKESIDKQIDEVWDLGVREIFPYHDVNSALGGTGLFQEVLNFVGFFGTGGFWETYDCPNGGEGDSYFYNAGAKITLSPPGFGNDPITSLVLGITNGKLPLYPTDRRQCNARGMTDLGEYVMQQLMAKGFIIDIDHAELSIKSKMLEIANKQTPAYPLISAHGAQGGLSLQQAKDLLAGGGLIYPMKPNGKGHVAFLEKLKPIWPASRGPIPLGYGMDANGIADRAPPRGAGSKPVQYPFTLFQGPDWGPQFAGIKPMQVNLQTQPESGKTWPIDEVGTAHYGMMADYVEEVRLEGGKEAIDALYRSAEAYIQMWEQSVNR